jgi:ABC-type branched-subunit amino acid transport system ATPase component
VNRLDLVVGPNGAGMSTFVELTLAPLLRGSVFVNADEIAKQRWPEDPQSHAYDAAKIAAETRSTLVERRVSFIAETVFSHPSKLDLVAAAKAAEPDRRRPTPTINPVAYIVEPDAVPPQLAKTIGAARTKRLWRAAG